MGELQEHSKRYFSRRQFCKKLSETDIVMPEPHEGNNKPQKTVSIRYTHLTTSSRISRIPCFNSDYQQDNWLLRRLRHAVVLLTKLVIGAKLTPADDGAIIGNYWRC